MNKEWYNEARNPGSRPRSVGRHEDRLVSYDRISHGAQVRFVRFYDSGESDFWGMSLEEIHDDKTMQRRIKRKEGQRVLNEMLDFYNEQQGTGMQRRRFRLPWSR